MSATRILGAFILQASLFAIPHLFSRRQLPKQPHTFYPCRDKRTVTISCHDNDTIPSVWAMASVGVQHPLQDGTANNQGRHPQKAQALWNGLPTSFSVQNHYNLKKYYFNKIHHAPKGCSVILAYFRLKYIWSKGNKSMSWNWKAKNILWFLMTPKEFVPCTETIVTGRCLLVKQN